MFLCVTDVVVYKNFADKFGLSRCPAFRVNKVMLPKHRNKSESCDDGSDDKKDRSESKQDQDSSYTSKDQGAEASAVFNNPSAPTMYETRKYGHDLPMDSVMPSFETLPCIPTGIFRCTAGEVLGSGAKKEAVYKNPEYFSFHHMTFYDFHLILRCYRKPCPCTGRKK